MLNKIFWICTAVLLLIAAAGNAEALSDQEQLGKNLFSDMNLSEPAGQGCISCHDPATGFADPRKDRGVSPGIITGRFGNRNAPTAMYQAFSPDFALIAGEFVGGQFWDQRAANLIEQAKGPFLNPLEMNNPDQASVLNKIKNSTYAPLFNTVCGNQSYPDGQYTCIASAIAAFESTPELNRFSSKFDLYPADMTVQEKRGLLLFSGKGNCAICHPTGEIPSRSLFTDFDAENIGVPSNLGMMGNTSNLTNYFPFYYPPLAPEFNPAGLDFVDVGLAGNPNIPSLMRPVMKGKMKAPTLRNVELTAPYMHNGVFRTLKQVVHFYNTRDVLGNCANTLNPQPGANCWPAPEVSLNVNIEIGNLELTDAEENDIVAFLLTLTDGYVPQSRTSMLTDQEQLGKNLFTDTNLSTPAGQGCISCHVPSVAFTDPDKDRGVSEGAIPGRFGNRNAPSTAYAAFSPDFVLFGAGFIGGQFWDQRAANLTEQAKGPFLNPLEMNNPDSAAVLSKIQNSTYASLFNTVCGNQSYPDGQYTCMASAIAAFENTPEMNRFSSKFDIDQANMTTEEMKGFNQFNGKGKCSVCHPMGAFAQATLFTDFDAENIGVPGNLGMMGNTPALQAYFPFYYSPLAPEFNPLGLNFVDVGLSGNPNVPEVLKPPVKGAQKAPTLRNINLTAPYMHNGVFRTLKEVVHFYNTRDVLGNCAVRTDAQPGVNCWPAPEVLQNVNIEIGNLQLTDAEENQIVAFLNTLTDGYVPPPAGLSLLTDKEQLGRNLFSDTNLSTPQGQACQSCHDPATGFADPRKERGVSPGIVAGRFGNRNAPSTAYAAFSPDFSFADAVFVGGQFWDQRAANLTEQAKGPFLNPLEMNNPESASVLSKIQNASYAPLFNTLCGNQSYPDGQYTCMAEAIAAFENTPEMNRFSSKFDRDQLNLTVQEMRGFNLFNGKGNCAVCHPIGPFGSRSLFTDFDAENIGVPKNLGMLGDTPALRAYYPFYYPPLVPEFNPLGLEFVDTGLAGNPSVPAVMQPVVKGQMKAPNLRNVELTSPYMHNGVFRTLKEVVHFYNTRDTLGNCAVRANPEVGVNCWPAPEVAQNLNMEIGNLQLSDTEENDIVAFLLTLTDGSGLQQGGNINGRVTGAATGAPITGVVVTAGQRTALTDAGGNYTITNIAPGTYTVTAGAAGLVAAAATITVESRTTVTQDFVLEPVKGNIIGTVTYGISGAAVSGATVTAGGVTATTNAVGFYSISVAPGTYTVTVSAPGVFINATNVTVLSGDTVAQNFAMGLVNGNMAGTVTDAASGAVVAGAAVTAGGITVTTDAIGIYTIMGIAPGTYTMTVSAAGGFVNSTTSVTVPTGATPASGATVTHNIALRAVSGIISGTVTNAASGAPIADAAVTAGGITVTTNANGAYAITNIAPGTYTMTVSAPGVVTNAISVTLLPGDTVIRNFALIVNGIITGTVTSSVSGAAIAGAAVTAGGITATTNANGVYTISIAPGIYTLAVSAAGFAAVSGTETATSGVTVTRNFALAPAAAGPLVNGTITGTMTNGVSKATIAGATVTAGGITVTTDATGRYTISIAPGTYTLTVSAAGFTRATRSETVTSGRTVIRNFALAPAAGTVGQLVNGTITGTVTNSVSKAAIAGAAVTAGGITVTTDAAGRYTISIAPGTYTLTVSAAGFTRATRSQTVTSGVTVTRNFALTPAP